MQNLRLSEKIGYGLGDFASNLIFNSVNTYLMFFYTEKFGLAAAAASTLLFVARFWDALVDPVVGTICDRTQTRWGKFRPYLLFVPVPIAVVALLAYSTPDLASGGKLVWAYVTYISLMTLYSAINIPYGAMPAAITSDPLARAQLTTYRMIFAFGGGIIVNLVTLPIVHWFGGDSARGYQLAITFLALLAIIGYWACFGLTKERVTHQPEHKPEIRRDLSTVFASRPWWILLIMGGAMFSFSLFPFYCGMYYIKYVFLDESAASTFFTVATCGMLFGAVLNMTLVQLFDRRRLAIAAGIWGAVFSMTLSFVAPGHALALNVNIFLELIAIGVGAPVLWAMVGDCADYVELSSGRRVVALTASSVSFAMKLGSGIGGGLVGYALTHYGYVPNAVQSEVAKAGIESMMTLFPALGYLCFSLAAACFPITREVSNRLEAQLQAMRNDRKFAAK
ncbi:MFS transporter [Paraburkholderia sp. BL25I1N1]|uniref:MFS transporter n=1 Tax=Paraburkholderia sp. BL25I1N1 TaxID=1938804 RepID=UPI000D04B843|nr:glycoside-pentoside-hexuronide (GPH):cation symporter [Paraburkholderia sp. BL25I1N1]PRX92048.1 GPH family glycoside/pentoside/hexuronide:cation symporter [Paraburkholderia sp. BL25I1N1]